MAQIRALAVPIILFGGLWLTVKLPWFVGYQLLAHLPPMDREELQFLWITLVILSGNGFSFDPFLLAAAIGISVIAWTFWRGDLGEIQKYSAREPTEKERALVGPVLDELAAMARVPALRFLVVEDGSIQAAAIGRRPSQQCLLLWTGAMTRLSDRGRRALLAHEMAHFARKDPLLTLMTVGVQASFLETAAFIRTAMRWIVEMVRWEFGLDPNPNLSGGDELIRALNGLTDAIWARTPDRVFKWIAVSTGTDWQLAKRGHYDTRPKTWGEALEDDRAQGRSASSHEVWFRVVLVVLSGFIMAGLAPLWLVLRVSAFFVRITAPVVLRDSEFLADEAAAKAVGASDTLDWLQRMAEEIETPSVGHIRIDKRLRELAGSHPNLERRLARLHARGAST